MPPPIPSHASATILARIYSRIVGFAAPTRPDRWQLWFEPTRIWIVDPDRRVWSVTVFEETRLPDRIAAAIRAKEGPTDGA